MRDILRKKYIDMEPQKSYRPGYPIEKRGIYYLARRLSSQLDVVTEKTDYGQLEKCYSIWICRERIPKDEQMSISFYRIVNDKNVGNCHPKKEDYDLMTLVILRLGDKNYHSEEKSVLDFLTTIFHPHEKGFRKKISRYISFEEEFGIKEEANMIGLGESIYQEGVEDGMERGIEQGMEAFILDNLEENISEERIVEKLQKRFKLEEKVAREYFKKYASYV